MFLKMFSRILVPSDEILTQKLKNVILYHFYVQNFVSFADGSWIIKKLESQQGFLLQKQPALTNTFLQNESLWYIDLQWCAD